MDHCVDSEDQKRHDWRSRSDKTWMRVQLIQLTLPMHDSRHKVVARQRHVIYGCLIVKESARYYGVMENL